MNNLWKKSIIIDDLKIKDAISNLNETSSKIVIVVDKNGKFKGTITDGDVRRSLLQGHSLNAPIIKTTNKKAIVSNTTTTKTDVLNIMKKNKIYQIPILDNNKFVVGMHLYEELEKIKNFSNKIIIMAGGKGKRLYPLTKKIPKPLVQIAGKPMIQHIIESARSEGFKNFVVSINYLGHMIENFLGDGKKFNVSIEYIKETSPLGTAGSLSLINPLPQKPIIITNGDVFTDIKFEEILNYHNMHKAEGTMAIKLYEWQNPYGVIKTDGIEIQELEEKPVFKSYINAGVYVLSPNILKIMLKNNSCDMPLLFKKIKKQKGKIIAFPMHEPWIDVGKIDDLKKAGEGLKNGKN